MSQLMQKYGYHVLEQQEVDLATDSVENEGNKVQQKST